MLTSPAPRPHRPAACPPKGYTAHVLGYTVHAVVAAACSVAAPGDLDDSLLQLLALMEADLFGDVADAKEAAEFASAYKEARKCRGYETYQLLAGVVAFGERVPQLLTTVQVGAPGAALEVQEGGRSVWRWRRTSVCAACLLLCPDLSCPHLTAPHPLPYPALQSRLGECSNPKTRNKLALLLQHASRGVLANPTGARLCAVVDVGRWLLLWPGLGGAARGAAGVPLQALPSTPCAAP